MTQPPPQAHPTNLSVLSYAQGFTLWHYRGVSETLASLPKPIPPITLLDIADMHFWAPLISLLSIGDIILISCRDGGTQRYVQSIVPLRLTTLA